MTDRKPFIVCAANRLPDGTILCGARHWDDIMRAQARAMGYTKDNWPHTIEQGFIDQFGKFYSREAALLTITETGQKIDHDRNCSARELFSEGLY